VRSPEYVILLPEIESLERTHDGLSLRFVVPASLAYFEGHFPDCQLLPGVVQIGWAVELARQHLQLDRTFDSLAGVKFMRVIQPGDNVALHLAIDADNRELSFKYQCDGQTCSSGRVRFTSP
jgi:3-hydroxymyristoyl/3-hydroxydecanoyl-(acyl carrier protein) dehydratase